MMTTYKRRGLNSSSIYIIFNFWRLKKKKKILFENSVCRVVEFKGKCFVDEIMDGEVIGSSIGMDREDVQDYLNDAGFNIKFN